MQRAPSMHDLRMLSSDLDGTLVGNPASTARFKTVWEAIPRVERPLLCYNTGRLIDDTLALVESAALPAPDYVLGGIGTLIWDATIAGPVPGFVERFAAGWDLARVEQTLEQEFPAVRRQPPEFLHPYKSSWYLSNATRETIAAIDGRLNQIGLDVVVIYSSQHYLDVLPLHASKGRALAWLAEHLDIPPSAILVAGDSGNDSTMFLLPGVRGILVENAEPELFEAVIGREAYAASGILADGVLDGLRHYGVIGKA